MKGSAYTLVYAAVLGAACALLLTGAASFTAPYRQANSEAEEARNILIALNVPLPEKASSTVVLELRAKNVQETKLGDMATYVYSPSDAGGKVLATAVRFAGPGLWGPIKGFLALEADMKTIRGITFYEQEETPGLGGEIATRRFTQQFDGQRIASPSGEPRLAVHAISGATMTSRRVQEMLERTVRRILETQNRAKR